MGTRFTRVTVVGQNRQVDVSLPADEPLSGQLPTLLRLLSVPTPRTPVRWVLSTPETGVIARDRSLDDAGILDGTVLRLTSAQDAALPPFVDDVEAAAAEAVTEIAPAWADAARRHGLAVLLAVTLGAGLVRCAVAASPVGWAGAGVTAVLALLIGALIAEPAGAAVALLSAPALALLAVGLQDALADVPAGTPLAALLPGSGHVGGLTLAAAVAGVGLLATGVVRQWTGLRIAGVTAIVLGGAATAARWLDLQADRTAGLVLLLAVLAIGMAGQLALGGAGLVNLMRFDEDGQRVPRTSVRSAVRRGQSAATGLVWCSALLAAAALWVLVQAPGSGAPAWINRVVAAVGGLIFAVRARMFTRARQMLPMLLAAVVTAAALALAVPQWLELTGWAVPVMGLALLAVVLVVLLATGLSALPEVPRARMRRILDLLDSLSVLALIPLLMLLFAVIPAVQRWLG